MFVSRYEYNRQASPLLRLPAEIRIRIYELVLGNKQIYITYKPWQHKRRIKQSQLYYETIAGGFRYQLLQPEQNPWHGPRNNTALSSNARITLLSGVCRQLYHETALLPQKLNPWSFENTWVMERFIMREDHLTLLQRRAIHVLWCREHLTKAMEKKFGSLQVIVWKDGNRLLKQDLRKEPDIECFRREKLMRLDASQNRLVR